MIMKEEQDVNVTFSKKKKLCLLKLGKQLKSNDSFKCKIE